MVTNTEEAPVVEERPSQDGEDALPKPYITMSMRVATDDHERLVRMAKVAHAWGITQSDSLSDLLRLALARLDVYMREVYVQKRGGVH